MTSNTYFNVRQTVYQHNHTYVHPITNATAHPCHTGARCAQKLKFINKQKKTCQMKRSSQGNVRK